MVYLCLGSRKILLGVSVAALPFSYIPLELYPHLVNLNYCILALAIVASYRFRIVFTANNGLQISCLFLAVVVTCRVAFGANEVPSEGNLSDLARELAKITAGFLLYRIVSQSSSIAVVYRSVQLVIVWLTCLAFYQMTEGVYRLIALGYTAPNFHFNTASGSMRPFGTFGTPVVFGIYLAMLLGFVVKTRLDSENVYVRRLVIGFGGLGLGITYTRSAWIAIVLAFVVIGIRQLVSKAGRRPRVVRIVATVGVVIVTILILKPEVLASVASRLGSLFDSNYTSNRDRITLWSGTLSAVDSSPLRLVFGYGSKDFTTVLSSYVPFDVASLGHPHNAYLEVLFRYGLVGLCAWLAIIWSLWRVATSRSCSNGYVTWNSGPHAVILIYCISSFFENIWTNFNVIASLFLLAGTLAASEDGADSTDAVFGAGLFSDSPRWGSVR